MLSTYDALATEIQEGRRKRPNWVKAEIRRTDVWVELLELRNIAEADKELPEFHKPPVELRREVQELAKLVCAQKPYNWQHDRRPSVELLNLVFEIQRQLFVEGGYVPPEEAALDQVVEG